MFVSTALFWQLASQQVVLGLDEVVTIMVFVMAISMAFTVVDIMSSKLSVVVMMINKIPYKMFNLMIIMVLIKKIIRVILQSLPVSMLPSL